MAMLVFHFCFSFSISNPHILPVPYYSRFHPITFILTNMLGRPFPFFPAFDASLLSINCIDHSDTSLGFLYSFIHSLTA